LDVINTPKPTTGANALLISHFLVIDDNQLWLTLDLKEFKAFEPQNLERAPP